jgi:predicted nucleic acid-binding Zn finger protein
MVVTILQGYGQQFSVWTTRQLFVYVGVDNPITAVVENCSCDSIVLTTDNGSIKRTGNCQYLLSVKKTGKTKISVKRLAYVDTINVGYTLYNAVKVPDPVVSLSGFKSGSMINKALLRQGGLIPHLENFGFTPETRITEFKIVVLRQDSVLWCKKIIGNMIKKELDDYIDELKESDVIIFCEIKATGHFGSLVLQPVQFYMDK